MHRIVAELEWPDDELMINTEKRHHKYTNKTIIASKYE